MSEQVAIVDGNGPCMELGRALAGLGCAGARVQRLNRQVLFTAEHPAALALVSRAAALAHARTRRPVRLALRSLSELRELVAENPFARAGERVHTLRVGFLPDYPAPGQLPELGLALLECDAFTVRGREVYLHRSRGFTDGRVVIPPPRLPLVFRNWPALVGLLGPVRRRGAPLLAPAVV